MAKFEIWLSYTSYQKISHYLIRMDKNISHHASTEETENILGSHSDSGACASEPGSFYKYDNLDLDALDEAIKEDEKITRILRLLKMMAERRESARAFSRYMLKEHKINLPHQTLSTWKKKHQGKRKNLKRKEYTRKNVEADKEEQARLQNQLDFVLGHYTSVGTGFQQAWKFLNQVSVGLGWGEAMTVHRIRHRWRRMDDWERDYYKLQREEHYSKYAAYARSIGLLPNEIWQIDELQFTVPDWKDNEIAIYAVACVDRATQAVRAMEFDLCPINKVSFLRACKRAFLPNSDLGTYTAAKPEVITVDNAKFHEPKTIKKTEFDFRMACVALEIIAHWNHNHSPRENCMVENWNHQFKGTFVPTIKDFMNNVAPAQNAGDTKLLLAYAITKAREFVRGWNTEPDKKGRSRVERSEKDAKPESRAVTADEIDRAVRVSLIRSVGSYGILLGENEYFTGKELVPYVRRKMRIRVRPEGPGEDVDAYFGKEFVATVKRPKRRSSEGANLNDAYKAQEQKVKAKQAKQVERFRDIERQQALTEYPVGHPMRSLIERNIEKDAQRKLRAQKRLQKLARDRQKASPPPPPPADKPPVPEMPADEAAQTITAEVL